MKNRNYLTRVASLLAIGLTAISLTYGQHAQNPDHPMSHEQMEEMNKRGDKAMGFDHLKTTHHFLLESDGGAIKVEANYREDGRSRDQIREHLRHIAVKFSAGDFKVPMLIHAETPPGAAVMQKLKAEITYEYKELERGALIRISTSNADALKAVHDFLRYQIREHMTGDPLEPKSESK